MLRVHNLSVILLLMLDVGWGMKYLIKTETGENYLVKSAVDLPTTGDEVNKGPGYATVKGDEVNKGPGYATVKGSDYANKFMEPTSESASDDDESEDSSGEGASNDESEDSFGEGASDDEPEDLSLEIATGDDEPEDLSPEIATHDEPEDLSPEIASDDKLEKASLESVSDDEPASSTCKTIGGPGVGSPCIFPFYWERTRKNYTKCTKDVNVNEFWCSTKVTKEGHHMSGRWGECDLDCPGVKDEPKTCKTVKGNSCQFPQIEGDILYNGCISPKFNSTSYCYIQGKKENCPETCPQEIMVVFKEKSIKEIFAELNNYPTVATALPHAEKKCKESLEKKFKNAKPGEIPSVAKTAENLEDAISLVCKNSKYCKNSKSPFCTTPSYTITLRREIDCLIECSYPV